MKKPFVVFGTRKGEYGFEAGIVYAATKEEALRTYATKEVGRFIKASDFVDFNGIEVPPDGDDFDIGGYYE